MSESIQAAGLGGEAKAYRLTTLAEGDLADGPHFDLMRLELDGNPPGVPIAAYAVPVTLTVERGTIRVTVDVIEDGGEVVLQPPDGRTIPVPGRDEPCVVRCNLRPGDIVDMQAGDGIAFRDATYGYEAVDGSADVVYAVVRIGPEGDLAVTCRPCPDYP